MDNMTGFEEMERPQSSTPVPRANPGINPYIRCPIPPINANPDTLRQFDESGSVPVRRVLPLPVGTVAGGNTTIEQNTTIIQQGGSGGGGGSTALTPGSLTINLPALSPSATYQVSAILARCYQLVRLICTQPVEVRLYGNAAARGADISRLTDIPVPFQTQGGIITDVVFDTAPFEWGWQNRVVANSDSPQTQNLYITVVNPSNLIGVSASTMTIQYLPLEV